MCVVPYVANHQRPLLQPLPPPVEVHQGCRVLYAIHDLFLIQDSFASLRMTITSVILRRITTSVILRESETTE